MLDKNSYFREIFYEGVHVATHVKPSEVPPGLNFVTTDDKFMQLGIWKYDKNHELPPHFHNEFERKSFKTNEFVFVAKGKLQSDLYTEEGKFIETVIVDEGEGILLHNHAHHYKILEDSIILESKNGPFMGVEKDKTVINVKKSKN